VREDKGERAGGRLCAAGLAELGFDPDRLIQISAPDTLAVLRAGADSVKCGQVGAVVIEPWGKAPLLDLTASRRLSMAAAASGVLTLMLRVDAVPVPSAAQTRWEVASAPSAPLAACAPGFPAFDISLLRHRGGISGLAARLEWNRDERKFALLSGSASADAAVGADQARKAA
jgi:protein ImuA